MGRWEAAYRKNPGRDSPAGKYLKSAAEFGIGPVLVGSGLAVFRVLHDDHDPADDGKQQPQKIQAASAYIMKSAEGQGKTGDQRNKAPNVAYC